MFKSKKSAYLGSVALIASLLGMAYVADIEQPEASEIKTSGFKLKTTEFNTIIERYTTTGDILDLSMTNNEALNLCFREAVDIHNNALQGAANQINTSNDSVDHTTLTNQADIISANLGENIKTCNRNFPNGQLTYKTGEITQAAANNTVQSLTHRIQVPIVN